MEAERENVARAIWNLRREREDRCDQELEDLWPGHDVWEEADAAIAAMSRAAQAAAVKVPALLSESEQRAILRDPVAIACLIGHHDCEDAASDAFGIGDAKYHERRALELLAIGRAVIAEDPDLWTEAERKHFAPRYSERAAATANTPTPGGKHE